MNNNQKLRLAVSVTTLATAAAAHAEVPAAISNFLEADAPFKTNFDLAGHSTDFQFYGIIDLAYGHATHALDINDNLPQGFYPGLRQSAKFSQSRSDWFSGGLSQNRVGIKAASSLFQLRNGSDVKAVLNLETGFNPLGFDLYNGAKSLVENSGNGSANIPYPLQNQSISNESSQNGQLFNRLANAGFSNENLGTITFGLNTNTFKDILLAYDPVNADNFSALGQSGTIGGSGGVSENQRLQNSLKYTNSVVLPSSFPLENASINVGAVYQWGNDINTNYGYAYATQIGLESKFVGIQAGYNRFSDAISAQNSTTTGDISANAYNTHAWLLALRVNPTPELKISGGWERFTREYATDQNIQYGDLWGYNLDNSGKITSKYSAGEHQDSNVFFLGAGYDIGARFPEVSGLKVQAGFYDYLSGQGNKATGTPDSSLRGRAATWAGVVDYQINKRFDFYVAYTNTNFSGAYYSGYDKEQAVVATGLRLKF